MADFGDNFDQNEIDPAAEFLAREQSELGIIDDDFKASVLPTQVVNGVTEHVDDFGVADYQHSFGNEFGREGNSLSPSPPLYKNEVKEEPEKIRKWREDQIKRLEEKDIEEEKKKEEWREIAKKELEEWYRNHEDTIAKTKAANRNAEKQFVADDNEIEPGTEWERIAKLCDFNPKAKQGSKDVSRMRSLILQMKQTPLPMNNA